MAAEVWLSLVCQTLPIYPKECAMTMFASIAERRIQEAINRGELDDLALRGQPLPKDDCSEVPEELRIGFKILKNAGYLPEEVLLQKEILSLKDLLRLAEDPAEQSNVRKQITLRQIQFDLMMEKKGRSLAAREYESKLFDRLVRPLSR
jgi:hypothetical protein